MLQTKSGPDNGSGNDGLNAAQKLEVRDLVEVEVEKSEDRVLRAIADLKGDLNKRLDRMDGRLDDLAKVKGAVYVIIALLAALLGSGFITWWLSRMAA